MSHFRAINLPASSPESRQLSPKVVLPAKRSNPAAKTDIGLAVAQAHKATHNSKKKKRKSDSRQQAWRDKKVIYSIEHSKTPSPAPLDDAKDGDYLPTAAELAETTLSTAQSTPSQRSSPKDASTCRNTGSLAFPKPRPKPSTLQPSSQAACALAFTKMESSAAPCNSPTPEVGLEPKPLSPSLWSSQLRKKIYQQEGVVELPKEVYDYQSSKKEKKRIDQQLATKRKDMREGKRKEKGKSAEHRPVNETDEPNHPDQSEKKMGKKRERDELEHEPRKRQKLQKSSESHEPGLEDHANDSQRLDEDTVSKQKSTRSLSKHKSVEMKEQRHRTSVTKADGSKTMKWHPPELEVPEEGSRPFDDPALRTREQQGVPPNEDWRKPFSRREVHLGEGRTCLCKSLPEFFTKNPDDVPCLATWQATCRGEDREFFKHVKQISCCQGSVHPRHVINACRKILKERRCSNRGDTGSVVDSTQGILSNNGQDSHNLGRAQSSIPPPLFYGSKGSSREAYGPRSFTPFMPQARKATCSLESLAISKPSNRILDRPAPRNAPAKDDGLKPYIGHAHADSPVDQLTTADPVPSSETHPVPLNSSVLGKRNRAHVPNFDVYNDSTPEEDLVGKEQGSNTPPEASKQPEHSFKAKRQRHQSVPANLPSRKPTGNELSLSSASESQRREGVLQEICNNAFLKAMKISFAPMEKCIKDLKDCFLSQPPAQTAAVTETPAPAGAPMPNAAPQPENNVELPRTGKRRRKSVAERKREFPELSRDVPAHLRLPDADLIAIGHKRGHYERHKAAPYTFTWHGCLWADYDYLLRLEGNDWTAKEIKRVSR